MSNLLFVALSVTELILLAVVIFFFWRLRRSEAVLSSLQSKQDDLLNKLRFNAQLEQELVSTFQQRQQELLDLDTRIEERAKDLRRIIRQAEQLSNSPQMIREAVLAGHRDGKSPSELAQTTGLSQEEIELIIGRSR